MSPGRLLASGGMILLLSGLAYGAIFGLFFHDQMGERRTALQKEALERIGEGRGQLDAALKEWEESHRLLTILSLNRSTHSHLTLMGLASIVFSTYIDRTGLGLLLKYFLAVSVLVGAILLPTGVATGIWRHDPGQLISIIGGSVFFLSPAVVALGYVFRRERDG